MSYKAAVITVSDRCSKGLQEDTSGPALAEMMTDEGYEIAYRGLVPDEQELIENEIKKCADEIGANIILTTGGTGFSPRDVTPEATRAVIERETPFIPQAMLYYNLKITPRAMFSRMVAGIRKNSLIINLPGSRKASTENLSGIIGALDHALHMLAGEGHE